jgi:hypothetical protein
MGAGAYLLCYLLVYLTQRGSVEEHLSVVNAVADLFGGDPIPAWQAVGWLFYNAHLVGTRVPDFGGTSTRSFIANADDGSLALLYSIPPLFLVAAGYATVALDDADPEGLLGALAVAGYLPLAVSGILLFEFEVGDGVIAPEATGAVLLAGIVYPVVFGAVGGVLRERS